MPFLQAETVVIIGQILMLFVGVDRGSLWVLEEDLPLALAVGDFDSVTQEERQVIQKTCPAFCSSPTRKG